MGYSKIMLYGEQTSDYLYMQKSPVNASSFRSVNSEPTEWNSDVLLLAKFNKDLVAGDSKLVSSIEGYEIRRRKGASSSTEYVATIEDSDKKYLIDYGVENNSKYTYFLYPSTTISDSGAVLSPSVTDEVKTDWSYWSLIIADESEKENVFYMNKLFKFELNLSTEDMSNNAVVSVVQNFTKFPTVQYGTSNYWSGGLSSLCGFISCNDTEYIQTPNMINELKALTSDTRRKFLKDPDGDMWEVKITSPVVVSTNDETIERVKSVKISWSEVGDASGISIINNPDTPSTEWVLTETGEAVPYVNYMWDSQYIWDDTFRWTGKENVLETANTNIGRNLFEKEGEV